jgi:hypothetical protein
MFLATTVKLFHSPATTLLYESAGTGDLLEKDEESEGGKERFNPVPKAMQLGG